jgi:hypothetical protein
MQRVWVEPQLQFGFNHFEIWGKVKISRGEQGMVANMQYFLAAVTVAVPGLANGNVRQNRVSLRLKRLGNQ